MNGPHLKKYLHLHNALCQHMHTDPIGKCHNNIPKVTEAFVNALCLFQSVGNINTAAKSFRSSQIHQVQRTYEMTYAEKNSTTDLYTKILLVDSLIAFSVGAYYTY